MKETSNSDSNGNIEQEPSRKRARVTGSTEGMFDKMFAEAMENFLKEKKIEESIQNIHKVTLEISDSTIKEVSQLREEIQMIKTENSELKQKMGQQEDQIEKLQKENLQNEIKNQKLKEYILKMKENHELAIETMKTENLEWKQKMEKNLKANYQPLIIPSDNCKLPLTAGEREYLKKCIFCKSEEHISIECRKVPTFRERRITMCYEQNRCMKCLDVLDDPTKKSPRKYLLCLEKHTCPRANVMCSDCNWDTRKAPSAEMTFEFLRFFHHPIMCDLNDQSDDVKVRRQRNNERRKSVELPPRFAI